ncbi:MAG TPA: hypothetical protein VNT50_07930 [Microbacterium sp.]|uniref:hypothetical protein n=1 Tax=Microbacterium sp. TaxID=51671 RepID=UPI002B52B4FF|nr:hypothetical protein [Microbacterium sp.]HWI31406.1 hypothetical protein [Microbacterium sp.]
MNAKRSILALSAGIALVAFLSGCATGSQAPTSSASPDSGGSGEAIDVDAAWLNGGTMIGLVTYGSSSCVPTAGDVELLSDGTLVVELVEPEADTACTRDMAPRVTLVDVPEGVDPSNELEIAVTGEGYSGDADLEGVTVGAAPEEYGPSAGWIGADDSLIILTWGSSTCVPVIETAEPTGPTEVTVTFATPPEDQVCTMDMAPRGTLATVTGLEGDADVELVLAGAGFEGARVPVLGEN